MIPGKHSISEEKLLPEGGIRQVKRRFGRGLRKVGYIERQRVEPGQSRRSVFWTSRKTDEKLVADQAWSVPVTTIEEIRNYGVTHVGLRVEDGSELLAGMDLFGPAGLERGVQRRKVGELQWVIPEGLFQVTLPPQEVRQQTLLEVMQIKGRRD